MLGYIYSWRSQLPLGMQWHLVVQLFKRKSSSEFHMWAAALSLCSLISLFPSGLSLRKLANMAYHLLMEIEPEAQKSS